MKGNNRSSYRGSSVLFSNRKNSEISLISKLIWTTFLLLLFVSIGGISLLSESTEEFLVWSMKTLGTWYVLFSWCFSLAEFLFGETTNEEEDDQKADDRDVPVHEAADLWKRWPVSTFPAKCSLGLFCSSAGAIADLAFASEGWLRDRQVNLSRKFAERDGGGYAASARNVLGLAEAMQKATAESWFKSFELPEYLNSENDADLEEVIVGDLSFSAHVNRCTRSCCSFSIDATKKCRNVFKRFLERMRDPKPNEQSFQLVGIVLVLSIRIVAVGLVACIFLIFLIKNKLPCAFILEVHLFCPASLLGCFPLFDFGTSNF